LRDGLAQLRLNEKKGGGRRGLVRAFSMSEERKYNLHSSYKHLFRVRPVLYRFGDIPLPIPIKLESLIVFIFFFLTLYPVCAFIEPLTQVFLKLNALIMDAIFSGLITYYSQNVDPAGKFLPVYIYDILSHFARNRRMWLGGPLGRSEGKIYENFSVSIWTEKKVNKNGKRIRLK